MDKARFSAAIKTEALRLGFDACGIARAHRLDEDGDRLDAWLSLGYHAGMEYMARHIEWRKDPTRLVEGAVSVISVLQNYFPARRQIDQTAPVLSCYAYGKDYHGVVRKKLHRLRQFIHQTIGPEEGRIFVDSAPVLDKAWAVQAGLGWIGKNTLLISPAKGSFVFIGSLVTTLPLAYDAVKITDLCGDCNRCIRACPTGALVAPRLLDSSRCISYLTIENRQEIPDTFSGKFNNRVFGCDICQDVCPWNRKSSAHNEPGLEPLPGVLEMSRGDWHGLDEESFEKQFAGSAVKRAHYTGISRNLAFLRTHTEC